MENETQPDLFFLEPAAPQAEARLQASEAMSRLLIWLADAPTLKTRGVRATVALYCVRPDLIDGATLERIGELAGITRQAVHKVAENFRFSLGLKS